MRWYIVDGSRKRGPYTANEIHRMLCSGEVSLDTPVVREGSSIRRKLVDVRELFSATQAEEIPVQGDAPPSGDDRTRFVDTGNEATEQTDAPPRGGTVVVSVEERRAEVKPQPQARPAAERKRPQPPPPPREVVAAPPEVPESLSFDVENLSPEQIFQSIAMPVRREGANPESSPFAMNSWNLLGARAAGKKERKAQEHEHLASPDLQFREKPSRDKSNVNVQLATHADGGRPPRPEAPKETEVPPVVHRGERPRPRIQIPRQKPALYQKPHRRAAGGSQSSLDVTVVLLVGACAALVALIVTLFFVKKPARDEVEKANAVFTEALPPLLPSPVVEPPPVRKPKRQETPRAEPLQEAFSDYGEEKQIRKRKTSPTRAKEPAKEKSVEKPRAEPKPHFSARPRLVPTGWPAALRSGAELARTQARLVSVVGVRVGPLPPQCSPCRIRGTLPDGAEVVLVSPNLQHWKAAGAQTGDSVALKGMIIRKAAGETWLMLQGVHAR